MSYGKDETRGRTAILLKIENKIVSGSEFNVYRSGPHEVIKVPRRPWLMWAGFGNFRRKTEADLVFLEQYFSDFLPPTQIVALGDLWGIRQRFVTGTFFSGDPCMTPVAVDLFVRALSVFRETGKLPDLLNPGNLIVEHGSDKLYLIDTSVLGRSRRWPIGYWISGFLARIFYDTIRRRLRSGEPVFHRQQKGRKQSNL